MRRTKTRSVALAVGVAACLGILSGGAAAQAIRVGAAAPEVAGGPWIGSEPLTIAALRGRVVLVEFWTYG